MEIKIKGGKEASCHSQCSWRHCHHWDDFFLRSPSGGFLTGLTEPLRSHHLLWCRLMLMEMQLGFCYHSRARAVNNSGVQSWNRKYWTGDNLRLLFVLSNNGTRGHPHLLLFDVSTEREKKHKMCFFPPIFYPKQGITPLKAGRWNTGLKHSGGRMSAIDHFRKTGAPRGFQLLPQKEVNSFFPELRSCWGQNKSPWPRMEQPAMHHLQGHSTISISQCFTASHRGMCCCVKICSLTHCQSVTEIPSRLEQARRQGKKKTHKFQYLTSFYAHFYFSYLDCYSSKNPFVDWYYLLLLINSQ